MGLDHPMTTHADVLDRLSADTKTSLTERSNAKGLMHLTKYFFALALCTLWIASEAPFWGVVLPIQGVLIVFLFTLCHECTHQTPFKSVWLNEWTGRITGFLLLLPFLWFRYFHLAHHRFTNDPEKDPELAHPRPANWVDYFFYVSGIPYWRALVKGLFHSALGRPSANYIPVKAVPRIRREARILLALYSGILLSLIFSPLALWIWIVPAVIGQPALRLYLLAEHGRCPPVANMLENTRTTFTNRVIRFLAWNMPYHIEHHSFPNVPFHALPRLHEHMKEDLITTSSGYWDFSRDYVSRL